MTEILIYKIQRPFLAQFLFASLLGVSAKTRTKNSGAWIGNDWNSDGEQNRSDNGRSVWDALYDVLPSFNSNQ
jgi:hypothetical protein